MGGQQAPLPHDRYMSGAIRWIQSILRAWAPHGPTTRSFHRKLQGAAVLAHPGSRLPSTGSVTYTATYRWDRGATVDGEKVGNTIANQAAWN